MAIEKFYIEEQGTAQTLVDQHNVDTTAHEDIRTEVDGSVNNLTVSGSVVTFTKNDGTSGTITTQDTRYNPATPTSTGLMSDTDKAKLDTIQEGANNYTLPNATKITLGGIKVGDNLVVTGDGVLSATAPPVKLYDTAGQNTDGAMTQKATTDALADKASLEQLDTKADKSELDEKADKSDLDTKANTSDLADVAFSGDYEDLINTPEGGHQIIDPTDVDLPNRSALQFSGETVTVTDDELNNRTIVDIELPEASGFEYYEATLLSDAWSTAPYIQIINAADFNPPIDIEKNPFNPIDGMVLCFPETSQYEDYKTFNIWCDEDYDNLNELKFKADSLPTVNFTIRILYSPIKGNSENSIVWYVPSVSPDGTLSWTNNAGLPNPTPVNIKGPPGADGQDGVGDMMREVYDKDNDGFVDNGTLIFVHQRTGNINNLIGNTPDTPIITGVFKATSEVQSTDTWQINGVTIPAFMGKDPPSGLISTQWYGFYFDGTQINFKLGGGSGLNITTSLTQPASAKDNDIWIISDTLVSDYIFQVDQPTAINDNSLKNGDFWFKIGNSSSPAIVDLSTKDGARLYVSYGMQYINGAWVEKQLKVMRNNTWQTPGSPINLNYWTWYRYATIATYPKVSDFVGKTVLESRLYLDSAISINLNITDNYSALCRTYLLFNEDTTLQIAFATDDGGTVTLNGTQIAQLTSTISTQVVCNFKAGWNELVVCYTEGGGGDGWNTSPKLYNHASVVKMAASIA